VHVDTRNAVLPGLPGTPPSARKAEIVGHLPASWAMEMRRASARATAADKTGCCSPAS
jgi:hypothetical protein